MIFILRNSFSNFPKAAIGIIVMKKVRTARTLVTTVILYLVLTKIQKAYNLVTFFGRTL